MVSRSLSFLWLNEKASDSSLLFSKAPCQCNVPAGMQTTSPSANSTTEEEEDDDVMISE